MKLLTDLGDCLKDNSDDASIHVWPRYWWVYGGRSTRIYADQVDNIVRQQEEGGE